MDISKYTDRKYLRRINKPGYAGWQFVFQRKNFDETKHFNDLKCGSPDEAYKQAVKYRDDFFKEAAELGILAEERMPLNLSLSSRNTSGIIGISRASRKRKDRNVREEEWLANYKDDDGKPRQKKFTISVHGEKMALYKAIQFRIEFINRVLPGIVSEENRAAIEEHIEELGDLQAYVGELEDDSDVFFFLGTINNPLLENTQKQDILNVRIGQKKFRRLVLDYWGHKCAVTGTGILLGAGHIKPWRDSDNSERLDVYNGLSLSPVYDRAFDMGLISFDAKGQIMISSELQEEVSRLGISESDQICELNFMHQKYLEYHRSVIFKG